MLTVGHFPLHRCNSKLLLMDTEYCWGKLVLGGHLSYPVCDQSVFEWLAPWSADTHECTLSIISFLVASREADLNVFK